MDKELIEKANEIFLENFAPTTCFERAIFFSWYCSIGDCAYCYMSTQQGKSKQKIARRTVESLLAETLLCKKFGWEIGFVSGGHQAYTQTDFRDILEKLYKVAGDKFWINVGPLSKEELSLYKPFAKGVVASIETINPEVHKKVCPSKPIEPFEEMLSNAKEVGMKRAMTVILGLGETISDFGLLKKFIKKHGIEKIHFYGLNPQKDTIFERSLPPTVEYQAEWIAKTRIAFPKIDIQCGIWKDRVDRVGLLLKSGANSISKFPVMKKFGKESAKEIEKQAKKAGREFKGTLTKLPKLDWNAEVEKLDLDPALKEKIKEKLKLYLKKMR
ncbi:MAG: radical SAM protein [archaeon]